MIIQNSKNHFQASWPQMSNFHYSQKCSCMQRNLFSAQNLKFFSESFFSRTFVATFPLIFGHLLQPSTSSSSSTTSLPLRQGPGFDVSQIFRTTSLLQFFWNVDISSILSQLFEGSKWVIEEAMLGLSLRFFVTRHILLPALFSLCSQRTQWSQELPRIFGSPSKLIGNIFFVEATAKWKITAWYEITNLLRRRVS